MFSANQDNAEKLANRAIKFLIESEAGQSFITSLTGVSLETLPLELIATEAIFNSASRQTQTQTK